jgi:hypothetical protein
MHLHNIHEPSGVFVKDKATKLGGRKPPMSGKGSIFGARVTAETRAALEAEAERTGRSKSQVGEIWLEQGRALSALGPASAPVTDMFSRMLTFASRVAVTIGDPTKSAHAREVLITGMHQVVDEAFPAALDELADEMSALRHAAHVAAKEIPKAGTNDKLAALRSLLLDLASGQLDGRSPQWDDLGHALEGFAETHGSGLLGTGQDRLLAGRVQIVVGHMIGAELVAQKLGRQSTDAALEARILLGKEASR